MTPLCHKKAVEEGVEIIECIIEELRSKKKSFLVVGDHLRCTSEELLGKGPMHIFIGLFQSLPTKEDITGKFNESYRRNKT
jgi:hypothetical protein